MKERPILMSSHMVRAILEGRKTQTRRVIADKHLKSLPLLGVVDLATHCPYGQVGDKLWVREKALYWDGGAAGCQRVAYQDDAELAGLLEDNTRLKEFREGEGKGILGKWQWKPSIFMPRWASRITLEITAIRPQRLQEITEWDAEQEGDLKRGPIASENGHYEWFKGFWDSINAKRGYGWAANPWCWCLTFRVKRD